MFFISNFRFQGLQSTNSHWFLGSIDRIHTGLIPANYVQPVRQQTNSSIELQPQLPANASVTKLSRINNKKIFDVLFFSLDFEFE